MADKFLYEELDAVSKMGFLKIFKKRDTGLSQG